MWMERVLFSRKERSSYWRKVYGDQNFQDKVQESSLFNGILEGDYRRIRELVAHDIFSLEQPLMGEDTPLQYAIKQGDSELVRVLLSLNASVSKGYARGQTPIEKASNMEKEEITYILIEALITDLALAQGLIPADFGYGERDNMGEGSVFHLYSNYVVYVEETEKLYVRNHEQPDALRMYLFIGISDSEKVKESFFIELRKQLTQFGYQIWKVFWDYDTDYEGNRSCGSTLEITRYTIFKAEDRWMAYEYMFPYDDRMEEHLNVLMEWDRKYGILFEELDDESFLMSFEQMPEDREQFWSEAISIFPKEDDLDRNDKERRRKRFINNGMLELLMI
jgi:hypothetical protein